VGGRLAEDVHVLVHDPRTCWLDSAASPAWAGRFQLAAVDRDEQRDDVLPVAEAEFLAEQDGLAAEVAAAAVEFVAVRSGDEVAARPEHDRRCGEQVGGVEACLPPPAVLLQTPGQQSGWQEDDDQVDAAAGMDDDAVI
jgi:hypothetical protein